MESKPLPGSPVKFIQCTIDEYNNAFKDPNSIYFVSDGSESSSDIPRFKKKCKNCGGWGWSDINSCEYCNSSLD